MVHRRLSMKSITIHGLDTQLYERIKEKADHQGLSLNKTIKALLSKSLGIKENPINARKKDFMEFFGAWDKNDADAFAKAIEDLEQIDPKEW
jgi:hypothetical protein